MSSLHGDLEVEVVSGENFVDRDNALFNIIRGDWSDVWVTVTLGTTDILTTGVRKDAINTVWGEHVICPVCEDAKYLDISVRDKDDFRSEFLGSGRVVLGDRDKAWSRDGPVYLEGGKGRVNMKIRYTPALQSMGESMEVPRSYFPLRKGGSLTLYQDAHATTVPGIVGTSEGVFEAMADAIRGAKKFVYISAWSLWTGTRLERDKETLGELLKQKAGEGVRVILLIWNEKFSAILCAGLLNTFDEDTEKYFEHTSVHVANVRRKRHSTSLIRAKLVETVWSHHQKMLVADDGKDDLVAFVGGLDLTKGRWDTPDHQLFSTLAREHRGDFHNGFVNLKENQGPREPWHDVHARLTGRAAVDLLRNFEERWRQQVPKKAHLLVQSYEEVLTPTVANSNPADEVTWQMQVVRSIDGDSAMFSSGRVGVLDNAGGRVVDNSLHKAMVRLIRRAQDFIYIESQYFIGSSQAWEEDDQVGASNLVPLEIVQRVVGKIRAGEEFRVYIVVPMIPEGNPDSLVVKSSMKAILHYQYLTMQMMYGRIAAVLKEVGSKRHPTDYLLFLCLGKKESQARVARSVGVENPTSGSDEWKWRQKSRFLIYVHSKTILADDAHIVIGSANLNQRSLDGTRDTEVAVAACQVRENNTAVGEVVKDGAVRDFRKSLWAEHTSGLSEEEPELANPSSLGAIRKLRQLADDSLDSFASDSSENESRNRFLRYPLDISQDGTVTARPGMPNIPDFDLPVIGSKGFLPVAPTI
ncbi:phospholipase D gamma 2-like [Homarus americanus]|uniref:phospholipase D n=1 Tax=Homarus americanus TaxID=6706 RepID=A0A8J5K172_HOMAM|nr:phospholipase D gamma 2-like [Homarus americanus]KAG7168257.1 Phospholipase D gamma 2-like [Homarus americanus]